MQKHRASLSQFPSQFWIPGATDLGFSFSQSFMIQKSSFWLFEILAGAFPPSRTHSPGYWLAMSVLCYTDLSTGSVAFKVEFLERWGGRGGKEDVWKPLFYSAVLGVTAPVCCGTLQEGSLQDVNIAPQYWEPMRSCWMLIAILTEV